MGTTFNLRDFTEKYNNEVHFRNNKDEPFYRWYSFVEGFSGNFVKSIIRELDCTPSLCLDPFSGSGTTPLACQELGIKCLSFEINPFLHDLTKAKLYRRYDRQFFEDTIDMLEQGLVKHEDTWEYPKLDPQTLFEREHLKKWILNRQVAWAIFDILTEIENLLDDSEGHHKLLLRMALASNLLDVSNVFRNGKCLSYKPNWQSHGLSRRDVHKKFISFCRNVILQDMQQLNSDDKMVDNYHLCRNGDARKLIKDLEDQSVDLVITSPPYLNSRDYTDIYRLELWMLGYLKSYADERELRKSTLRSHVQILWPNEETLKINRLTEVLKELEKHREELWNRSIPEMIKGYFADMNVIFEALYKKLKGKSKVYLTVGNSSYCEQTIETDAIIAEIAEMNRFQVDEIRVARYLKSSGQQDSKKIRESIIVLTKT